MQSLAIQQKMSENADMSRSANQLASNILLNRKKKEDTHRMAEANRAFSHFRW